MSYVGIGSSPPNVLNKTKQEGFQDWISAFDNLLSSWYTDPANEQDDIDRIYRQEEAEEWLDLLEAYGRGEVEYDTLINWQPDFLRDIDGFNDYIDGIRTEVTWERNANYNIAYCEENGCRDEGMQRFYDKWLASGSPDSKDGMLSDDDYDKYILVPNTENDIRNILRNEGYNEEDIDELINSIVDNDDFYGSTVLANVLRDLGYYEAGNKWDVSPVAGSSCTADDGTIGAYNDSAECISQGVGSEGDPCGYAGEGTKDASGNCIGGEDSCDNPTYAANRPEECSEVEPLTDEEKLVRDYGQEAVDKAKEIYNGVEDWVEGTIEDPMGAIKGILDQVYSGMSEECKESNTNKPDDWWKDCTNLSVLGQIPGLPIPLPPGTIDVNTTVRDLEDAAKEAGKTLEDIFNPTCTGTPAEIQECENRTISDIIGDWASDVWDSIKGAWEDLEDKTEQGLLNILIDAGYNILSGWIFTQIKDAVSTENPLAFVPLENCVDQAWLEQASPEQKALCQGNVVNCADQGKQGGYINTTEAECGPCENPDWTPTGANGECVDPDPNDCEGQNKSLNSDGTCGECLDSALKDFGQGCEAPCEYDNNIAESSPECKEPWTDGGPTEEACASQGRLHVPGDASTETDSKCGGCLPTHTEEAGECTEWADGGPTQEECESLGRVHRPSTGTGRDSSCGGCLEGYEIQGEECVEESIEEPCPGEQIRNEETRECEDPPPDFIEGEPCTTADNQPGTYDSQGGCVPDWVNTGPTVEDCEALGKTHVSGDPSEQKASECGGCKNSTWNPIGSNGECVAPVECWDGSTQPTEAECPEEPPKVDCASKNRIQEDEYTCGGCLNETFEEINGECVEKVCDESSFQEEVVETTTIPYGQGQPRVQAPTYTEINGVCTKTTYEVVIEDPTQADCEAEGKVLGEGRESNTCVEPTACDNGATLESGCEQCEDGSVPSDYEEGKCGGTLITEETPCKNGATLESECTQCEDGSAPEKHEGGNCNNPLIPEVCGPETFTAERTVEVSVGFGEERESTVEYAEENGECTKVTTVYVAGPPPPPPTQCGDGLPPPEGQECVECPEGSQYPNASTLQGCGPGQPPPLPCPNGATLESECTQCEDGSLPNEHEGGNCNNPIIPEVCGPDTIANTVNLTETLPYGSTLPAPQTTYGDVEGVCTATVTTYVEGPPNCTEITKANYEDCGYVQCPTGSVEPYANSLDECYDPVQPCEDPNRIKNEDGSCSDQCEGDKVLQDQGNGSFLCGEPPCGPNTVDQQVEQNVVIPFGEPLPESQTSYEDDGTQCVATTVTYTQGAEPQDCASYGRQQTDEFTCGECLPEYRAEGDECIPKEQPDCASLGRQQVDIYTCGECLGGYTLADDEVTCSPETCADPNAKNHGEVGACGECEEGYSRDPENPDSLCTADPIVTPEGCEDPTEEDFGNGCEQPCPDDSNIGISDALCGDTTVTTCLDDTATNFNEEGPCVYGPIEEICENGATDYPECTQCADGSLPDANLGCGGGSETCDNGATDWPLCSECPDGTPTDPDTPCSGPDCSDPDYAAANPEECTPGPECIDCTCPEYAAANPEECGTTPPPPPPPEGGGGGGGSGGQGKREPIEFGISADPELLARKQFPITDYLSGLFTGNR